MPPIRLGNGLALWLGVALLAHAALLVVPVLRSDGPGSRQGGLQVRLTKPVAGPAAGPATVPAETERTVKQGEGPTLPPRQNTALTNDNDTLQAAPVDRQVAVSTPVEPLGDPVMSVDTAAPAKDAVHHAPQTRPASVDEAAHSKPVDEKPSPAAVMTVGLEPKATGVTTTRRHIDNSPQTRKEPALTPASSTSPDSDETRLAMAEADSKSDTAAGDAMARSRLLELTGRLHQAIEREKRYPLSARRLGREGTTSVAFRLRPDGAIDDLEVAASSGEPSLDRAALRAVRGISPFGEARTYLDETAPFRVDIAFRLR